MSTEPVDLIVENAIATITLRRPKKLNALTTDMLAELEASVARLERDGDVRVVLLTGEGDKAFCAGADISEWGALEALEFGRHWIFEGHRIFDRIARLRQPVIAVLNGITLGGGLELAATADLRIAEEHVRVGLPEARIGIIPGWSGTQRLVRRVGPSTVKRLIFTGEPVDATEALRLGLVDFVVAKNEGLAKAREIALTIAQRAPVALLVAKQLVNIAEGEEGPAAIEALAGAFAATTMDAKEGVDAFRGKRTPKFHGR